MEPPISETLKAQGDFSLIAQTSKTLEMPLKYDSVLNQLGREYEDKLAEEISNEILSRALESLKIEKKAEFEKLPISEDCNETEDLIEEEIVDREDSTIIEHKLRPEKSLLKRSKTLRRKRVAFEEKKEICSSSEEEEPQNLANLLKNVGMTNKANQPFKVDPKMQKMIAKEFLSLEKDPETRVYYHIMKTKKDFEAMLRYKAKECRKGNRSISLINPWLELKVIQLVALWYCIILFFFIDVVFLNKWSPLQVVKRIYKFHFGESEKERLRKQRSNFMVNLAVRHHHRAVRLEAQDMKEKRERRSNKINEFEKSCGAEESRLQGEKPVENGKNKEVKNSKVPTRKRLVRPGLWDKTCMIAGMTKEFMTT